MKLKKDEVPKAAPKEKSSKLEKEKELASAKADKASERIVAMLTTCQKTKDALAELTPDALWRSLVRATELDRRLGKVAAAERDLQKIGASDKADWQQKARATQMQDEINSLSEVVSAMKHVCSVFRMSDPGALTQEVLTSQELAKRVKQCAGKLFSDFSVLMDIIHTCAKKLVEASCVI